MTSTVSLRRAVPADRVVLERLWQLYRHDLSEFRDSRPDAAGLFRAGPLTRYLDRVGDPDVAVYLLEDDGGLAGFALVRGLVEPPAVLGEFFVLRSSRRSGVGREAARQLLAGHPGTWEIAFQEGNPRAARFWRRVAAAAVGEGCWVEERRPVPDKPHIPPDTWLRLEI